MLSKVLNLTYNYMHMEDTQSLAPFQTFSNTLGQRQIELATLLVDGEPWFHGADAAAALGYSNVHQAIRVHVDDLDKESCKIWLR